jgi:hypothetical protein
LAARKKELDKQRKQLAQLEAAQADAKAAIAEALKQIKELETLKTGIEDKLGAQIVLSKKDAVRPRVKRQLKRCVRLRQNERIEAQIEAETRTFRGAMKDARASRCSTAICWGPSNKFAFEVLAEIPIAGIRNGLGSAQHQRIVVGEPLLCDQLATAQLLLLQVLARARRCRCRSGPCRRRSRGPAGLRLGGGAEGRPVHTLPLPKLPLQQ